MVLKWIGVNSEFDIHIKCYERYNIQQHKVSLTHNHDNYIFSNNIYRPHLIKKTTVPSLNEIALSKIIIIIGSSELQSPECADKLFLLSSVCIKFFLFTCFRCFPLSRMSSFIMSSNLLTGRPTLVFPTISLSS